MPNNGKWVRCTCGLSHWGSTEESRRVMLHRCAKNHVDSDDLVLDGGQCRLDSSIFCIMSHTGNHRTHARCKEWLTSAGVPEADIAVVYGYKVGRDYHMGKPIKSSEVLHYGVHHKWFPRGRGLLKKRKEAGKRTTAVWFIEADARSETPMEELVAKLNNPYADRPVRWLGFFQMAPWGAVSEVLRAALQKAVARLSMHCFQGYIPETNARFFARDYEILPLRFEGLAHT